MIRNLWFLSVWFSVDRWCLGWPISNLTYWIIHVHARISRIFYNNFPSKLWKYVSFVLRKIHLYINLHQHFLIFLKPTRHFENLGKVFLPRKTIAQYTRISGFNATTVPWFFLKIILIYFKKKRIFCIA